MYIVLDIVGSMGIRHLCQYIWRPRRVAAEL